MTAESVARLTGTAPEQSLRPDMAGLSQAEVTERRARGQGNDVSFAPSRSYLAILRDNAFTSINLIIFGTSIALVGLQLYSDALVTAGIVLLNIMIAVVQEIRSKRALDRIALLTRPRANVIRNGERFTVDPAELVVGDLVVVERGDQVVVDGRVVAGRDPSFDESLLTGESDPVEKQIGDTLTSGSFCVTGQAIYEAERVGMASMANKLTARARSFRPVKTPVQREVDLILRMMVILSLVLGGPVVLDLGIRAASTLVETFDADVARRIDRAYRNYSVEESVRSAAVILGLIPQGLALMLTVTYAMGALRLLGQKTLLQQANAVESLSHVDVLCLDKTGTITTNRLRYVDSKPFDRSSDELAALLGDYAANVTSRNSTVEAIAAALPGERRAATEEVAFSSSRKWSALYCADRDDGRSECVVMGAPEVLSRALSSDHEIQSVLTDWTSKGYRVLMIGLAYQDSFGRAPDGTPLLPEGMRLAGLIAFEDELQPNVQQTIRHFADAGIELKIISGDHPETVATLAVQAGFSISEEGQLVSGLELAEMDEAGFARAAEQATVFGRITPEQKLAIIRALQKAGRYVAMTGDGVNDVLALKQSQVGIAMEGGSQASRAVADLVLLGNSFASLPQAFAEGQRIVRGTQDLIKLFIARSLSLAFAILGAGVLAAPFPMLPTHAAVPAFLVLGVPTLGIAAWTKPGRVPRSFFRAVMPFAMPAALSIGAVETVVFVSYLRATDDLNLARTMVTLVAVLCGLVLILFVRPPFRSLAAMEELTDDWKPTLMAGVMLALLVLFLTVPSLRDFFQLSSLDSADVLIGTGIVVAWAVALQIGWRHRWLERWLQVEPTA